MAAFQKAIEIEPNRPDAIQAFIAVALETQQAERALPIAERVVKMTESKDVQALMMLAEVLSRQTCARKLFKPIDWPSNLLLLRTLPPRLELCARSRSWSNEQDSNGIESLIANPPSYLRDRRLGLLMNQASVDARMRYASDLVTTLFSRRIASHLFAAAWHLWRRQANMIESGHGFDHACSSRLQPL